VLACACRSPDPPQRSSEVAPTPAAAGVATAEPKQEAAQPERVDKKAAGEKCTDWSKLDVSTLDPLPDTPFTSTFEQVWRRVLEKHYDPTIACLDWPALRKQYGDRLAHVGDANEAIEIMKALIGELDQSHFAVINTGKWRAEDGKRGPARPPVLVRWIEDQAVVVRGGGGIAAGAILVAIDGRPVKETVDAVKRELGSSAGIAFDIRRRLERALSCQPGESRSLTVIPPGRAGRQEERSAKCELPLGELVTFGNLRDVPTRVEHRLIEGTKVGYLAFNIWMLPMIARVKAAMTELRAGGMEALVLDLRGNLGGMGPMSVPVARMLLKGGGSLGKLEFRDFTQEFNVPEEADPFLGDIVLLVDEGTASTSEIFAVGMRDLGRVKVVGACASAGAALPSVIEELDEGIVLQYVVGDYHSPKGTVVEGKGVVPDVVVPETAQDFADGRDPVLDAAVKLLQNR
jgi:carboxyl-terminal processing protease